MSEEKKRMKKITVQHPYKREKDGSPLMVDVEYSGQTYTTTAKYYKFKYQPINHTLARRAGSNELQQITKEREKWLIMNFNVEFIPEVEIIKQEINLKPQELRNILEDKVLREMAKVIYFDDRRRPTEQKEMEKELDIREEKISTLEEEMKKLKAENDALRKPKKDKKDKNGSDGTGDKTQK